jgi:PHS family inorganic phosphate transporter-like MFS transporter
MTTIGQEIPRWQLFKDLAVTGIGFASDAYDIFVINLVIQYILLHYKLSTAEISVIAAIALIGTLLGQLTFGFLAKKLGRTKTAVITLALIMIGSFGAGALTMTDSKNAFIVLLVIFRFILGFGIGGEYPLSATLTWEKTTGDKIRNTGLMFSMQGIGALIAPIIVLFLSAVSNSSEIIWRTAVLFGLIFASIILKPRLNMHDSDEFKTSGNEIDLTPMKDRQRWLMGTAGSWLIFDIAFYANGLFSSTITQVLNLGDSLHQQTINTLILACMALPGYYFGVYLVRKFDMKYIQGGGFIALSILYLILASLHKNAKDYPGFFMFIYGLTFFASNSGPNLTTYILPVKLFHVSHRPFYHGISAASGKFGAIIGAAMLKPCVDSYGISSALYICAVLSLIGFGWTMWLIPTDIDREKTVNFIELNEPVAEIIV